MHTRVGEIWGLEWMSVVSDTVEEEEGVAEMAELQDSDKDEVEMLKCMEDTTVKFKMI